MLPVTSMRASIAFYQKLGFQVQRSEESWGWAQLSFGDCGLMLDQSINRHSGSPRDSVLYLYLYPEDVVEYHRFVRGNGLSVPDLEVTFYGMTEFRLEDPDGNRWWIGQEKATGG